MMGIVVNRSTVTTELELPHNVEVECEIIGLVIGAREGSQQIVWRDFCHLTPDDFFDEMNRIVWTAILKLHSDGLAVDLFTVLGEVSAEYGGVDSRGAMTIRQHLCQCAGGIVTRVNNAHYASLIREMSEKRMTIKSMLTHAHKTAVSGFSDSASELAGAAIGELQAKIGGRRDLVGATTIIDEILDDLDAPVKATATGLPRLDYALRGGFHEGRLYGIGADQKAGKSTMMAATMSYNMALRHEPHVYICLEMKPKEIFQRYLARWIAEQTGADTTTDVFFDREETSKPYFRNLLLEAREIFSEKHSGLYFLQRPRMHIDELKSTLSRIGLSGKYKGVFIDYLQLVSGGNASNMTNHLDNVAQTIAEFTADNPIWVCAAAQMNQEGNVRGGNGFRAACDVLLGLHKIEYEGKEGGDPYYKAWIEMQAIRYAPPTHIGSELMPAYDFNVSAGPSYKELPRPGIKNFMQGLHTTKEARAYQ